MDMDNLFVAFCHELLLLAINSWAHGSKDSGYA